MKRGLVGLAAVVAAAVLSAMPAHALFISGFLAQCTAVASGSCTEQTATGYARQPIAFGNIANVVANSSATASVAQAVPYSFAQGVSGSIAGHAIYDAPSGGNLLAVLPYAGSYTIPSYGDRGDVGSLSFTVPAANGYPPNGLNTTYQAGGTIGATPDGSVVSTGIAFKVEHGDGYPFYGTTDATTRQVTETTGFSYIVAPGVSALNVKGAGTLATGAIALPIPQADGSIFRLSCSITVTALTVTPGSGATITGTAPTTCGTNASHELQYFAGDTTWHVLF